MNGRSVQKLLCGFVALWLAAGFSGVALAQHTNGREAGGPQTLREERGQPPAGQHLQESGVREIQMVLEEKMRRTPAQQKLDSHLHLAGQLHRGRLHVGTMPWLAHVTRGLEFDARGLVHVDIKATVSETLLAHIAALGGTVESAVPKYGAIRAWIPLLSAESLASRSDVHFIKPAARAVVNTGLAGNLAARRALPLTERTAAVRAQLEAAYPGLRAQLAALRAAAPPPPTVDTNGQVSEGADLVQSENIFGTGVKVGVLSDGVKSLPTLQASGDLPNNVTVLPGQAGPATGDEGTAMLEIVHDLAPGALLFFATAFNGEAQFATNIESLAASGCNIIVDDVTYFDEGVFQDTVIAQAVNTVTANGVLYFSSAANSGNKDSGTSGTWEGDFNGTGATIPPINTFEGKTVPVHMFDATHEFDTITAASSSGGPVALQWADTFSPAPCVDYDLFIMNSTLTTILDSSTNTQNCTTGQEPVEISSTSPAVNSVIVVVLFNNSGAGPSTRALHVDTERAQTSINTNGATFGHNAGASTLTVAATPAQTTIFTSGNQLPETYSSDGPRKIFFRPDGTAITSGNFLFSTNGGTTLAKTDFTAADCGQSAVPGFNPFCGTSAAAPTAASIAALMLSANSTLTRAQVISAMKSTALPAKAGFSTNTVGSGIVMANLAVNSIVIPAVSLAPHSAAFGTQAMGTSSGQISVQLSNTGSSALSISSITLSGVNSGDFGMSQNCPASLAPVASCMINVTFTPTAGGPRRTGIVINDNAPGSPHTVIVTGVGTSASISATSLTFSKQTVGTTSAPQSVTLTNKGSATMNLWQVAILGANAGDFSISANTCGATLAAGTPCTVSVTFKPTATGSRNASLFFSDDGGGSPQSVLLMGTGQ